MTEKALSMVSRGCFNVLFRHVTLAIQDRVGQASCIAHDAHRTEHVGQTRCSRSVGSRQVQKLTARFSGVDVHTWSLVGFDVKARGHACSRHVELTSYTIVADNWQVLWVGESMSVGLRICYPQLRSQVCVVIV